MKNVFRSFSFFLIITLFISSCGSGNDSNNNNNEEPQNEDGKEQVIVNGQIQGEVRSMSTKLPLDSVAIQATSGPSFVTDSTGEFTLQVLQGVLTTAIYTKSGYETLNQSYGNLEFIEKIIVYMEDTTTAKSSSKTLNGFTFKQSSDDKGLLPIDSIQVIATLSKDSVFTNLLGGYLLPFKADMPTYKYDFKIPGISQPFQSLVVTNASSIKDSSRLDVVFTGTATGIDIEPIGDK